MTRALVRGLYGAAVGLVSFVPVSAEEVFLSDLQEISVTGSRTGYCDPLCKDLVTEGDNLNPVTIEGKTFEKGLAILPHHNGLAVVKYALDGKYRKLQFYGGISDYAGNSWSEWGIVDETGRFYKLERKSEESLTHIKIGAGASISVWGDGRQIGDTLYVNARTKPVLSTYDVAGVQELALHLSPWGIEPCDAPYHSGGTYPGCPRLIGATYCDFIQLGDPKLIAGPDEDPPELKSVAPLSETAVKVVFDEKVTQESAENVANYSISDGIGVENAALDAGGKSVRLTTSPMTLKATYTLTVSSINDIASTPNALQQQSLAFTYLEGIPLDDGYFSELLCLEDAQGSPYLPKEAASDIEQNYAGGAGAIPSDGESVTAGGGECTWAVCTDNNGTWADGSRDNFVAFWHITVLSPRAREVKLAYRHDDDITAWHNGTVVLSASGWDNNTEQTSSVFSLVEGENHFLFKLVENDGGNRFAAGIVDVQNGTVPGLLYRFPDRSATNRARRRALPGGASAFAPAVALSGTRLTVSRLRPHRTYTVTLSDARGRVARVRKTTGSEGIVSHAMGKRSRGVYVVDVRSSHHSRSVTTVIP